MSNTFGNDYVLPDTEPSLKLCLEEFSLCSANFMAFFIILLDLLTLEDFFKDDISSVD